MNSRVLHNVYKLKKLIDRKIKNMVDIRSRANCNSIFMGKELSLQIINKGSKKFLRREVGYGT